MKKMSKLFMSFLMVSVFLIPHAFAGVGADGTIYLRDINADKKVGLHDIIYEMQLLSGMRQLKYVSEADSNGQIVIVAESGTIQGVVTEDTGDAEVWIVIPDALIVCVSEKGERFTQKSAEDGSFRFESLQPGQHVLAVSQPGYASTRIKVDVEPDTVVRVNVRLKKLEDVNGKVAGHVLTPGQDGQLKPLPGATVNMLMIPENFIDDLVRSNIENSENPFRKTQTDESGAYVLDEIPEGRYFVMASQTGFQKVLSIVSVIGGGISKRNMVLFPELSEETGTLMGKVVEKALHISADAWETYYPVTNAKVSLVMVENGTVTEIVPGVVSNNKGIFSFVNVPVGECTLVVRHDKFEEYRQKIVIKPGSSKLLPVINPNGSYIEIDGNNVDTDNPQWSISDPAKSAYAFLNFIQNVGSGCFCIDQYMNWHQDTQFVRVVLTRIELPQKAMLSGHVSTIDGDDTTAVKKPIPGATVVAVPYFPYPTLTASTDDINADPGFAPLPNFKTETNENGYYEFTDLPVGYLAAGQLTYIVAVYTPNFESSKDKVNVIPGKMVTHDVVLRPEGVIATLGGQVYDSSVKCDDNSEKCFVPIENADVSLFPMHETGDILPAVQGVHVKTDSEGKYYFPRLAAIEYQMIVNADNYLAFRQTIKLKSGNNDSIDVGLEPLEQKLRVKGVVKTRSEDCSDGVCEKPVPGAIVYAYPELSDNNLIHEQYAKTYTDENGVFQFFNVPEGTYHVVISARGFNKYEDIVDVPPEGLLELEYYIDPITEQGSVKGHVFNGATNCVGTNCITNIPGAEITLLPIFSTDPNMNIEPMFHAITNERGYYMIENIPAGKYQITARAEMFKPWEGFIEIPQGAETVQDITLLPENSISALKGNVFDGNTATGEMSPVPNASVLLVSMKNATWIAPVRTETDEQGHYYFKDIPSGEYQLTVRADKYQPFETRIYIPAGETLEKNIFLEHFVGEATIKGMVRDGSVRCDTDTERCIVPIAGAHIQLYFLTPDSSLQIPNLETTTDDHGVYELAGIPTGEYVMKVWADGFQERKDTIQIKELENELDVLLFPMTPIVHLKGQILDGLVDCDDGADCILPVPNARIELFPELGIENVNPFFTVANERGFYEFMDIPSGRYVIHIEADKYQERTEHINIFEDTERSFELIPATLCESNLDCSKSEFCAKPTGECEGDGMCRPRPEACPDYEEPVCGCDGNTYSNECYAASSGINVLHPGDCRPEPKYGILKGTIYESVDTATDINIVPQPIAGADIYLVELLSSDETYFPEEFKMRSNDDGTYAFEKLPVGKYTIVVRAYGYQAWKGEIAIVQDTPTIKDVYLISLSAEASVKGLVNGVVVECENSTEPDACLEPIADALILLTPLKLIIDTSDDTIDNMIEPIKTRTDDRGQYFIESLSSGAYNMYVEAAEWKIWEQIVTIQAGKENEINIKLDREAKPATLIGMVRNGAVDCDPNISDCIVGVPYAVLVLTPFVNDTTMQSITVKTDGSGQFKIDNLPVLRYSLTVKAENFEPKRIDISLKSGINEKNIELMPLTQCKDNSQCHADAFCKKQTGVCDNDAGICRPRPKECIMIYSPVCGCNERTYDNECFANNSGVNILYESECQSDQE